MQKDEATSPDSPSQSTWRVNLLLLAVSTAVALGLCEILLRRHEVHLLRAQGVYVPDDPTVDGAAWDVSPENYHRFRFDDDGNSLVHIASDNPGLVYELRPNARVSDIIQINSHGFRDHEFMLPKPPEVFRIVCLGDSITFGWRQRLPETYVKVLEARLNEASGDKPRFEVYNLGVGGYNAAQEEALLRSRGLGLEPDLVLVGYCSNDVGIGQDAGLWRHFTSTWSSTWDFVRLRWLLWRESRHERDLVERAYASMAALAREHGLTVAVALFPDRNDREGRRSSERSDYCRGLGMVSIDLWPVFEAAGMDELMDDAVHPNTRGHRVAGEAISDALVAWGLLERAAGAVTASTDSSGPDSP